MTLNITHSKWDSPDHFEALGFDDAHPNMVIRFDYAPPRGWHKWRHGGWLPIDLHDVPAGLMARSIASRPPSNAIPVQTGPGPQPDAV